MKTHSKLFSLFLTAASLFGGTIGPTGYYYLVDGQDLWVIHGGTATSTHQINGGEYGIAIVGSTIRTLGVLDGGPTGTAGAEYDLAGNSLNTQYPYPNGFSYMYDGTSDGTHNYINAYYGVYQFDTNWANPTHMFAGPLNNTGITWDSTNNSLWLTGWSPGVVVDYSMTGVILSSFHVATGLPAALALDTADNTLWMFDRDRMDGTFYQYSKTGTLLQTVVYAAMDGRNLLGGEITGATVTQSPEPSTFALAGLACILAVRRRSSRR